MFESKTPTYLTNPFEMLYSGSKSVSKSRDRNSEWRIVRKESTMAKTIGIEDELKNNIEYYLKQITTMSK